MRNRILSTGLLMTALIVLVFLSYRAVAEPDAQGGATTGEISPIAEPHAKIADARKAWQLLERIAEATHRSDDVIQRTKVAAGANANARLSLDLIANGGSGNRRNDGVTSGTVSGRGTTIAIEVFATGVTTSLVGMQLRFDFDASLVTFVKAENSAFAFNLPEQPTGTDFAATSPVTLPSSNFLARAEFTTASDVTGREFSIGIASVTLSESQSSSDRLTTTNRISFNVPTMPTPDFDGDGMVGFSDFLAFAGRYGTRRGDSRYQAKYDLNSDGAIGFSDFLSFAGSYGKRVSSPNGGGTPKIYWTDWGTDKIQRANLDGSQVEDLITTGLSSPSGIALDVERGKMYWTDSPLFGTSKIQRANLNGSNVEDLITTGVRTPLGIALDVERGKMYWADNGTAKIQRANFDGSQVEDLITTGLSSPSGIALDVERGKMYWTDSPLYGTNEIQRANLDGSNVEDLITTRLSDPSGIALDVERGKMYWTDNGTAKIERANLDGSNVEDLITTGLSRPNGIALDTSGAGSGGDGGGRSGSGGSSPDLIVESPSVSDNTLTPGQSFTLQATVRNRGTGQSASTTLRYYQSSKSTISTSDTEVGTDSVSGLSASGTGSESISLTAPSSAGTYYYGACVASVSGESNTDNNCSEGVRVTVEVEDDHSNTRSDATSLSLGGSRSGRIETGGDVDYFRVQVSRSGILTVYTTGNTDTYGTLQNSFGSTLATNDDGGSGSNFSITRAVIAGTYYIALQGYSPSTTGSYAVHAGVSSTAGAFHIDLVFPNDSDFTSSQKALFQQAATHWMSIITEDLPDIDFSTNPVNQYSEWLSISIRVNDTIDDLRIYVLSGEIDGLNNTLGQAGPLHIRRNSSLPSLGAILLDAADLKLLEEDGYLYSVILHEMGHVLGIGSLWSEHGLLQNPSSTNPGADTHFTGARAIQAFDNAGGWNYTGAKVPIENERDKAPDTHWRERVLDHELMTGWIEGDTPEALSAITIQSLADLGYRVDISRADAYSLPDPTQVSAKTAEGHGLSFENCIRSGPIYVVDEQGRVLRIIENEEHPAKE